MLALIGDVRGTRVLDASCGPGFYTGELVERGASVVAFDVVKFSHGSSFTPIIGVMPTLTPVNPLLLSHEAVALAALSAYWAMSPQ